MLKFLEILKSDALKIVLILGLGLGVGWWINKPVMTNSGISAPEKDKPAITNIDGSQTLARVTNSPEAVAKLMPILPKGNLSRVATARLMPTQAGPIQIVMATTEEKGGSRVTLKADGATISEGQDIVIPHPVVKELKWNAQILYKMRIEGKPQYGAMVGYHQGRIAATVGAFPGEVFVGIGVRW